VVRFKDRPTVSEVRELGKSATILDTTRLDLPYQGVSVVTQSRTQLKFPFTFKDLQLPIAV